jgi:short subunit dehydrogenase-like uncharacterized protein
VQQLSAAEPIDIVSYLSFRGVLSGGTERSAIKELAAPLPGASAYAYDRAGRSGQILKGSIHRARALGAWVTPYFDAVDSNIVLRSAAALERYGPRFSYTPLVVHANLGRMLLLMVVFGTTLFAARIAPLRTWLLKLVKPSGRGPTQAQMDAGWFRLRFDARCQDQRVTTEVSGADPGYGATSMMLSQCALCLLEDRALLPECSGAVTPAQAFGERLIARLQAHGMQFRVVSEATASTT